MNRCLQRWQNSSIIEHLSIPRWLWWRSSFTALYGKICISLAVPVTPPCLNVIWEHPSKLISHDQSKQWIIYQWSGRIKVMHCGNASVFPSLFIKYVTIPRGRQLLKMQYVDKTICIGCFDLRIFWFWIRKFLYLFIDPCIFYSSAW